MGRASSLPGIAVILLALAANVWMLVLEFQLDDFQVIASVRDTFDVGGPRPAHPPGAPGQSFSFRPTLWLTLLFLLKASGAVPHPELFHALFWFTHALAAWLLFLVLRARCGEFAATAGGLLFAILPGGIQAVSWISAGGDQLAVLFMLLAGLAGDQVLRTGSKTAIFLCGLSACLAAGAKETAILMALPLAMLWTVPPVGSRPGARSRVAIVAALLAGFALAWVLRAQQMGSWAPEYGRGDPVELARLRFLTAVVRGFLVPWVPHLAPEDTRPALASLVTHGPFDSIVLVGILGAVVAVLPLVAGVALASARRRLAVLMLAALVLVMLAPLLPIAQPDGIGFSRARYPAAATFAALIAASVPRTPGPLRRWWCLAALPLFAVAADLLAYTARVETTVSRNIHDARAELVTAVSAVPPPQMILVDLPIWIGGAAFLGGQFVWAACPPFGPASDPPSYWPSVAALKRCPAIATEPGPIRILVWDGGRRAFRGYLLAPIPSAMPELSSDASDAGLFHLRVPVPARALAGIQLELSGSNASRAGVATFIGKSQSRAVAFESADQSQVVGIPDELVDEGWVAESAIEAVRVQGPSLARPPVLLRELPLIAVKTPAPNARLELTEVPRVSLGTVGPERIRISLELDIGGPHVPLGWTVRRSDLTVESDGSLVFVADKPITVFAAGTVETLNWEAIAKRIIPFTRLRNWSLPAELVVEAFDATGVNPVARSARIPIRFVHPRP